MAIEALAPDSYREALALAPDSYREALAFSIAIGLALALTLLRFSPSRLPPLAPFPLTSRP